MRAILTVLAGAAMLAACGNPAPSGKAPDAAATPDPIEAKIAALNTNMRRLAFFRAIYDSGYGCKQVTDDRALPRDAGRASWKVTCDDGRDFVITLQPGGIFTVSGAPLPRQPLKPRAPIAAP